jgi:hypothetical protein
MIGTELEEKCSKHLTEVCEENNVTAHKAITVSVRL